MATMSHSREEKPKRHIHKVLRKTRAHAGQKESECSSPARCMGAIHRTRLWFASMHSIIAGHCRRVQVLLNALCYNGNMTKDMALLQGTWSLAASSARDQSGMMLDWRPRGLDPPRSPWAMRGLTTAGVDQPMPSMYKAAPFEWSSEGP